jgi:hypothetical protein
MNVSANQNSYEANVCTWNGGNGSFGPPGASVWALVSGIAGLGLSVVPAADPPHERCPTAAQFS